MYKLQAKRNIENNIKFTQICGSLYTYKGIEMKKGKFLFSSRLLLTKLAIASTSSSNMETDSHRVGRTGPLGLPENSPCQMMARVSYMLR